MSEPAYALQKAVVVALKGAGVCAGRVYDRVPTPVTFPFVQIGNDSFSEAYDLGADFTECDVTVHVYSRAVGKPELKTITSAVRAALDQALSLDSFAMAEARFTGSRYFTDPDGLTEHAVLTFEYLVQPLA
ncbi:DUF3168 domain-containing protein [Brevundimonas sp. 2R-24]|uniref:DUF3168 domain-containing protein n=1 Tax=Peiella sedimenti TaxID=3061083 RepID=A0ABT8SMV5_9CAUL|nr:DUF3168 domain-containing protein [Caulobacteraceae bacterium XZ-24]